MANNFTLTLDTLGPSNPTISINGGAQYCTASDRLATLTIGTSDSVTTGYQVKIWGDVDTTYDSNIQTLESSSAWITYATSKQIKLSATDATKTVYCKIRDDVYNVSSQVSDTIVLDSTLPTVTIAGPDVTKISKQTGKDTCSISFQSDQDFVEYKIKVVGSTGSAQDTGTVIGTANGSVNMSATGTWTTASVINSQVTGADLEIASSGDGTKIIKIFVRDIAGNWSA